MGRLEKQGSAVWEVLLVMMNVQGFVFILRQVIFTRLLQKSGFKPLVSVIQCQSSLAMCGYISAFLGLAEAQNRVSV